MACGQDHVNLDLRGFFYLNISLGDGVLIPDRFIGGVHRLV